MYLHAATLSADFIHARLYNVENVVQDSISGRANDSCATSVNVLESYNSRAISGLIIEGLAILYTVSQNASLVELVDNIVIASISSIGWQGDNGIIANGVSKSGDIMLPRGLAAAYTRNATSSGLRSYIASYLGVQYNAVFDLARNNGSSNIYGPSWVGPSSPSHFLGSAQANAIQALVSAITLEAPSLTMSNPNASGASAVSVPGSSPSGGTSLPIPTASPPRPPHHKSAAAGAIVGGTVGGLLFLLGAGVGVFLWQRRRIAASPAPVARRPFVGTAPVAPAATTTFDFVGAYNARSPLRAGSLSGPSSSVNESPPDPSTGAGTHDPLQTPSGSPLRPAASSGSSPGARTVAPATKLSQMIQTQAVPAAPPDAGAIPTQELVRLLYRRIHTGDEDTDAKAGAGAQTVPRPYAWTDQQDRDRPPDYRATLGPPSL